MAGRVARPHIALHRIGSVIAQQARASKSHRAAFMGIGEQWRRSCLRPLPRSRWSRAAAGSDADLERQRAVTRLRRLFVAIGGAHLLIAGSPCNKPVGNQIIGGW